MAWALAISNCRNYAWALAQEWALFIHPTKMTTWALTMWWVLAWDTTVYTEHFSVGLMPVLN